MANQLKENEKEIRRLRSRYDQVGYMSSVLTVDEMPDTAWRDGQTRFRGSPGASAENGFPT
jgi:hypothetical protein